MEVFDRKVKIIGAGFSGLSLGYYLLQRGISVEFFEAGDQPGGLLGSFPTEFGWVERAANGILSSPQVLELCRDLDLQPLYARKENAKRYIFRGGRARSFPFYIWEIPRLLWVAGKYFLGQKSLIPREGEPLESWGGRIFGKELTQSVLLTAFQGIYGSSPEKLSASLLFAPSLKPPRGPTSLSFPGGMGEWVDKMFQYLKARGVTFHFQRKIQKLDLGKVMVVATNASRAAQLLRDWNPKLSRALAQVQMLSLTSCTAFFQASRKDLQGYGCLLPRREGFHSLGVLFNSDIFPRPKPPGPGTPETPGPAIYRSETYILPGSPPPETPREEILNSILADRRRFQRGGEKNPMGFFVTPWPEALPSYDRHLEKFLTTYRKSRDGERRSLDQGKTSVFLTGNYLGQLGLSKILRHSKSLAESISQSFERGGHE